MGMCRNLLLSICLALYVNRHETLANEAVYGTLHGFRRKFPYQEKIKQESLNQNDY